MASLSACMLSGFIGLVFFVEDSLSVCHPVAVAGELDEFAFVQQAVEYGCGQHLVVERPGPFRRRTVGGYDEGCRLVHRVDPFNDDQLCRAQVAVFSSGTWRGIPGPECVHDAFHRPEVGFVSMLYGIRAQA